MAKVRDGAEKGSKPSEDLVERERGNRGERGGERENALVSGRAVESAQIYIKGSDFHRCCTSPRCGSLGAPFLAPSAIIFFQPTTISKLYGIPVLHPRLPCHYEAKPTRRYSRQGISGLRTPMARSGLQSTASDGSPCIKLDLYHRHKYLPWT